MMKNLGKRGILGCVACDSLSRPTCLCFAFGRQLYETAMNIITNHCWEN